MHVATTGTIAFYGTTAASFAYGMKNADLLLGAIVVVTGVLGALTGGLLMDRWKEDLPSGLAYSSAVTAAGGALVIAAFMSSRRAEQAAPGAPRAPAVHPLHGLTCPPCSVPRFFILFSFGCYGTLMANAARLHAPLLLPRAVRRCPPPPAEPRPAGLQVIKASVMWCVPLRLRSLSCGVFIVIVHAFGDIPAPPLTGHLQDSLNQAYGQRPINWRISMTAATTPMFVSAALFAAACVFLRLRPVSGVASGYVEGARGGGGASPAADDEGNSGGQRANALMLEAIELSHHEPQLADAGPRRSSAEEERRGAEAAGAKG